MYIYIYVIYIHEYTVHLTFRSDSFTLWSSKPGNRTVKHTRQTHSQFGYGISSQRNSPRDSTSRTTRQRINTLCHAWDRSLQVQRGRLSRGAVAHVLGTGPRYQSDWPPKITHRKRAGHFVDRSLMFFVWFTTRFIYVYMYIYIYNIMYIYICIQMYYIYIYIHYIPWRTSLVFSRCRYAESLGSTKSICFGLEEMSCFTNAKLIHQFSQRNIIGNMHVSVVGCCSLNCCTAFTAPIRYHYQFVDSVSNNWPVISFNKAWVWWMLDCGWSNPTALSTLNWHHVASHFCLSVSAPCHTNSWGSAPPNWIQLDQLDAWRPTICDQQIVGSFVPKVSFLYDCCWCSNVCCWLYVILILGKHCLCSFPCVLFFAFQCCSMFVRCNPCFLFFSFLQHHSTLKVPDLGASYAEAVSAWSEVLELEEAVQAPWQGATGTYGDWWFMCFAGVKGAFFGQIFPSPSW